MNELALFAGAGGGILGGHLLGWRTLCAVEYNAFARSVLLARQNDGTLPPFPIWDDVRTFDGEPWRGCIDIVSGGFPCQDISAAGKGAGLDGERSGLWHEMRRVIYEVRPRFVYVENSPRLVDRGLGRVLGDLAEMGFDAEWGVLGAGDTNAPHVRERVWVLAHRDGERLQARREGGDSNDVGARAGEVGAQYVHTPTVAGSCTVKQAWPAEPAMDRVADGVANRVDRLKAIGNGQVPRVAKVAWLTLSPDNG